MRRFYFKKFEVIMQKIFTLHLSKELHRFLEQLAAKNQRSMSGHLRWLILNAAMNDGILTKVSNSEIVCQKEDGNKRNLS